MNEANLDPDFDAAVIELKQGQRKGALKFMSFVILLMIAVGVIGSIVFSVKDFVGSMLGV